MNQVVYIIGIARSVDEKNKVTDIASEVFGVKEVIDYITLTDNTD